MPEPLHSKNSELYADPNLVEGADDNAPLHVPSIGCYDGVAELLCAGALNAVSLHGFKPEGFELPAGTRLVLVRGGDRGPARAPAGSLKAVDLPVEDAGGHGARRQRRAQHRQPHPSAARAPSWSPASRCATPCSPRTPARAASTPPPPPRSSGPSWRRAATRPTGSRPGRRSSSHCRRLLHPSEGRGVGGGRRGGPDGVALGAAIRPRQERTSGPRASHRRPVPLPAHR
jgi:hypothetical protein